MRLLLLLALALPAQATLTDEKVAFSRATPCPATGKQSTSCKGYAIVYPVCEATRGNMRWSTTAETALWSARAAFYCACQLHPASVVRVTTRGRELQFIRCRLWVEHAWRLYP